MFPLRLAYDLMNPDTGEITGHVDTSPWFNAEYEARIKRGNCSNQAYRIKVLLDEVENLIEEEDDPEYIKEQIALIDKRYEGWKKYCLKKIEKYS